MSPHHHEPQFLPLKCGVTKGTPHNILTRTTVGTIQASLSWLLALQLGLLDMLQQVMAINVLCVHHGNSPAPPTIPMAFLSLNMKWKMICQEDGERTSVSLVLSLVRPYWNFLGILVFPWIILISGRVLLGLHLFSSTYK